MIRNAPGYSAPSQGHSLEQLAAWPESAACHFRYTMPAAYLFAIHATVVGKKASIEGAKEYLQQLMADLGNPTDPLEQMVIQQIAIAHHSLGRLHTGRATATTAAQIKQLDTATTQQSAEFRGLVQVLVDYRGGGEIPTHLTQILQQNVAENQQVEFVGDDQTDR